MTELYDAANDPPKKATCSSSTPEWITVQRLAFSTEPKDQHKLEDMISKTSQATVRLPILRKVISKKRKHFPFGEVTEGQMIILDVVGVPNYCFHVQLLLTRPSQRKATVDAREDNRDDEVQFLTSQLSIAGKLGVFQPRRFAVLALSEMVKFIAQMRNPRRGHDTQGTPKRIHLGWIAEGYSNFMAPKRMDRVAEQVRRLPENDPKKEVFTDAVLRPGTDTYLTPNWDEMVPFPMTWKIRFDGFGMSDYHSDDPHHHLYGRVKTVELPAEAEISPPWYQPQGASHDGGAFAEISCICGASQVAGYRYGVNVGQEDEQQSNCPCTHPPTKTLVPNGPKLSTGCGLSCNAAHK